jgi:Glycosyl transferase family 2
MLRDIDGVQIIVLPEAGLPRALRAGRDAVRTPWFGTLDDDDMLMPDALARRVGTLEGNLAADVLVTNGINRRGTVDALHVHDDLRVGTDPLRALHRQNWLLPGSWLARTERVGTSLFDGMPPYRECTFLALRFCTEYAMAWMQEPSVVYHVGSPESVSHSYEYLQGQAQAARMLLSLRLPAQMRRRVRREIAAALHEAADRCWSDGALREAWRFHGQSLRAWCGFRFLPFTRHLILAESRRVLANARGMAE